MELGWPLCAPSDADFQKRVIRAAPALLGRTDGPFIVDYAKDMPGGMFSADGNRWVCSTSFLAPTSKETANAALRRKIVGLLPWFDLGRMQLGRTTFGQSGLSVEAVGAFVASLVASLAE